MIDMMQFLEQDSGTDFRYYIAFPVRRYDCISSTTEARSISENII